MIGKIFKDSSFDEISNLQNVRFARENSRAYFAPKLDIHAGNNGELTILGTDNLKPIRLGNALSGKVIPDWIPHVLAAYDESTFVYNSLEGDLKANSHCLTFLDKSNSKYTPLVKLTLGLYTQSQRIIDANSQLSSLIVNTKNSDSEKTQASRIAEERTNFIQEHLPRESIVCIDGPIFSGANTALNYELSERQAHESNSICVFFIKNSASDLVNRQYNLGYNNDLHWAFRTLKPNERTPFFLVNYEMEVGRTMHSRSKIFTYIKTSSRNSPVRIEFTPSAYELLNVGYTQENFTVGDWLFKNIQYHYALNGDPTNNQHRLIRICEMYAREALKSTSIYQKSKALGLVGTMNEVRGMW